MSPFLNGQNQDRWNTNQNQMKYTHLFIVFEVLKVLLVTTCKMQPLAKSFISCFMLDYTSADTIFH